MNFISKHRRNRPLRNKPSIVKKCIVCFFSGSIEVQVATVDTTLEFTTTDEGTNEEALSTISQDTQTSSREAGSTSGISVIIVGRWR